MIDSEKELDKIFLSYDKILRNFKLDKIKTKSNKEITHKDLRKAVFVMLKKHPTCRWRSEKIRSRKYFILIEGYAWLTQVYFQKEKSMIDADIHFFKMRIELYENLLKLKPKDLFSDDILYSKLEIFFNRKIDTIRKAIKKLEKKYNINLKFEENDQVYVHRNGIKLLCKECFKQKYLELLEQYKMELTEKYIEAGYIYDHFFYLN